MDNCRKCNHPLYKCKKCGNVGCLNSSCERKAVGNFANVCDRCGSTAGFEPLK